MSAEIESLKERVVQIRLRRPAVAKLLDRPNLGTLRVDVNQALEEIDDLLDEFERTFPSESVVESVAESIGISLDD